MASIITNDGRKIIIDRTYNDDGSTTYTAPKYFKVGMDQTTAVVTDTAMDHPIPLSGTDSIDDCETADWTDSADMTTSLNSTTYKLGSGALNLIKDGAASANANTYKTTTSIDFTGQEFSIWIYIKDATALAKLATTDCLTIRFGSGAGDYYQWTKDKADFAVGWNLVDGRTVANADSTTGTPVLASMDYTLIQLTATGSAIVWVAGDFIMDDIKAIVAADYIKAFTSQTIDETNLEVETRCNLSSVEANGYLLSGFGILNNDSTKLLFALDDFAEESKSITDEFIFIVKDKFS